MMSHLYRQAYLFVSQVDTESMQSVIYYDSYRPCTLCSSLLHVQLVYLFLTQFHKCDSRFVPHSAGIYQLDMKYNSWMSFDIAQQDMEYIATCLH